MLLSTGCGLGGSRRSALSVMSVLCAGLVLWVDKVLWLVVEPCVAKVLGLVAEPCVVKVLGLVAEPCVGKVLDICPDGFKCFGYYDGTCDKYHMDLLANPEFANRVSSMLADRRSVSTRGKSPPPAFRE